MITLKSNNTQLLFFANKIKTTDGFKRVVYKQSSVKRANLFFSKTAFYTLQNSLLKPDLLSGFKKSYCYEIKRALKENCTFEIVESPQHFLTLYHQVAAKLHLATIEPTQFIKNIEANKIIITTSIFENQSLAFHSYIVDKAIGKVRLLHSVTNQNFIVDSATNALVGRANRYLHHQDMLYFKRQGFSVYDFGGYAYETSDKKLNAINEFKQGFNGTIVLEYDYTPVWLVILSSLKKRIKAFL